MTPRNTLKRLLGANLRPLTDQMTDRKESGILFREHKLHREDFLKHLKRRGYP